MKKYFIVNTEPNCNILGLDPIIHAFWDREMEKLAGRRMDVFAYQISDGVMNALPNKEEWLEIGDGLYKKMASDRAFYKRVHNQLTENGGKLYNLCQEVLQRTDFSRQEIRDNFSAIGKLFTAICVPGLVAPIVEMGNAGVSQKVKEIFKTRDLTALGLNVPEAMSILITPMQGTWTEEFRDALYQLAQIIHDGQSQDDLVADFVKKYGWAYYGYCGPEYTVQNAQDEIANILNRADSPQQQLERIHNEFDKKTRRQNELMDILNFDDEERYWVAVAQDFGFTKAYRANLMALADYTISKLLADFVKDEGYSMKQVGMCTVREVEKFLSGEAKLPAAGVLNQRVNYAVLISNRENDEVLVADEARNWFKENVEVEEIDLGLRELRGTVACTGGVKTVQGEVRVVMNSSENSKVQSGDIMLSSNTVPDHVPAMRRAAAIVTQIGGLTCHAAIVSRELDKPCLIDVKHLLDVFKDGDKAEVDVVSGAIRKI